MRSFAPLRSVSLCACAVAFALVNEPAAQAQVFTNNGAITIPFIGTATPFPSTIEVSGIAGAPAGLRVRLKNFSHDFPGDVVALLVAPSGQGFELLTQNGFNTPVSGLTLTLSAEATTPLPRALVTGTFAAAGGDSALSFPASEIPRAASLAALIQDSPNGQWRLFVQDVGLPDAGSVTGGWEIEFGDFGGLPTTPSSPSTFTYQGRLEGDDTGTINARFSLWSHPSFRSLGNRLAEPVTVDGITVTNGLFSVPVNLGVPVPAQIQTWLEIEISEGAGSPFVTLTPRQPITATPVAGAAQRAALADFATNAVNATNATNATNAVNASSVPWAGITGIPANVSGAFSPWQVGSSGIIFYPMGQVGIGTQNPGARLDVTTGAIGGSWQTLLTNTTTNFRGGMRLSDFGFLEVTNSANLVTPNFARLSATGGWTAVSDGRLKSEVTSAQGNLAAALKLRPVNFRWKGDGTEDFGLIAQEVRDVLPRLVTGDETKDSLTLNYSQLSVVAIGAIQELSDVQGAQSHRIETLERENAELRMRLERLERLIERVETGAER